MVKEIKDSQFDTEVIKASKEKLILVDFWATWCAPCLALAPILEDLSKEFKTKVAIVKIDVDANPEVANTLGIKSIPTLILFKDGKAIVKEVGVKNKNDLVKIIKESL